MSASVTAFLESRLSRERLFVETGHSEPTVEAARFGLETLDALGADIPGVRTATSAFLSQCRATDEGFADRREGKPALNATYYAARLLSRGLVPGSLADPYGLVGWIRRKIMRDGRIAPHMDVDELYYAVRAMQFALPGKELPDEDVQAIVGFILRCASPDGGFGLRPGDPGDIERTYCCVNMLETLGAEHESARQKDFISACTENGEVSWDTDRAGTTPATFYWGLRAASLTGTRVAWREAAQRIEDFRCADGGYGSGERGQLWHTYCCVNALNLVGAHAVPLEATDAGCV
jgi:prenyltransferase beta subunit